MKVGDLIYWHEDAWLMQEGVPPTIKHAVVVRPYEDAPADRGIWHVLVLETGLPGIVHDTPNIKVKVPANV